MEYTKKTLLYEGKAKKVYSTEDENLYIVDYKDDATAFDGLKKGTIHNKGEVNNKMTDFFMRKIEEEGIRTHLVKELSDRETLVRAVKIVPLEVILRNIATGSITRRLGITEGSVFEEPVIEFCLKNDDLHDPIINEDHIRVMNIASKEEVEFIKDTTRKVNEIVRRIVSKKDIILVDFKLEFGRDKDGNIILADEISPDTCRFWDAKTKKRLDKDRFRLGLGNEEEAYIEIEKRVMED